MEARAVQRFYVAGVSALVFATAVFVANTPLQVSDNLDKIIAAHEQPFAATMHDSVSGETLRPLSGTFAYLVAKLPTGHPGLLLQVVNAVQAAVILLLFCLFLHPKTMLELALASVAVALFTGQLSFWETFVEGYPVNHFGLVLVCFLGVAHLTFRRQQLYGQSVTLLLLVASLTAVELGVIVPVALLAAHLAGRPDLNRRVLWATAVVLALYAAARGLLLDVAAAGIGGHTSGFGFRSLSSEDIVTRFGDQPLVWSAHNFIVSLLSVVLSEPVDGVWATTERLMSGGFSIIDVARVAASVAATIVVAAGFARVCAAWRRGRAALDERQIVWLFALVAVACAILNYRYVKTVLMVPAAACFAWSFYYGARVVLSASPRPVHLPTATLIVIASLGAAITVADLPCNQWLTAVENTEDWAIAPQHPKYVTQDAGAAALAARLRVDSLGGEIPNRSLAAGWNVCWTREPLRQ